MSVPKGRVLIVAGSDSGGGAGIQADLKTVAALGGYGTTAITALTAQNTLGVFGVHPVPAEFVARQMRTVLEDIGADAIKIGMLGNGEVAEAVADVLETPLARDIPVVLDPVMGSTSGTVLLDNQGIETLKRRLIPLAYLITPNLMEAEALTGVPARDVEGMHRAASAILAAGGRNVLVKGGHLDGDAIVDLLVGADADQSFTHQRIPSRHTHGTGCTLASAVAVGLAQGVPLEEAVAQARDYLLTLIRSAPGLGKGRGPLG